LETNVGHCSGTDRYRGVLFFTLRGRDRVDARVSDQVDRCIVGGGHGIQGGDAVDHHEQGHGGHDPSQPLAQLLHTAQQGQGRHDQGQQGGNFDGVDGGQGGEQEQDQPGQEKGSGPEPIRSHSGGGIGSLLGHGVASGFSLVFLG